MGGLPTWFVHSYTGLLINHCYPGLHLIVIAPSAEPPRRLALSAPYLFDSAFHERDLPICDSYHECRKSPGSGIETTLRRRALRLQIWSIFREVSKIGGRVSYSIKVIPKRLLL